MGERKVPLWHKLAAAAFLLLTANHAADALMYIAADGWSVSYLFLPVGYALVSLGALLLPRWLLCAGEEPSQQL